jgi:FkbM family methyltransferase
MAYPIVIPLHHAGGKLRDNTELRYALRTLAAHFKDDYTLAIVGKRMPDWIQGVEHIPSNHGLKTALKDAAARFPDGFFWWYDDLCLLQDQTGEELKVTPACRGFGKPQTKWSAQLYRIKQRLEKEGYEAWDYSRPHGPYWFDKSMVDEGFADWPGMKAKLPWETWILSKRGWPRRFGVVKQYYGAFRGVAGAQHVFLNYNDKGNTPELRAWLSELFEVTCQFERDTAEMEETTPVTATANDALASCRSVVAGVVIDLPKRPRWGEQCISDMRKLGIHVSLEEGVDGHADESTGIVVDCRNFRRFQKGRNPLPGEIGCYASHLKIARRALAGDIAPVSEDLPDWWLVFEDDAIARGDVSSELVIRWTEQAREMDLDYVFLHSGTKDHRNKGDSKVSAARFPEIRTHAALISRRGLGIIAGFRMCHPYDKAVSSSRRLRIGVLHGRANFAQRPWVPGVDAIAWERREGVVNGMAKDRVIVAGLHCGLGNQMFQIAAAAALAARHGYRFELAPCAKYRVPQGKHPREYKDTIYSRLPLLDAIGDGTALPERAFHYAPITLPRGYGRIIMGGWWQSARYQEGLNVKDLFDFSWYDRSGYDRLLAEFGKPICAVHFRGGDFKNSRHPSRYLCRAAYYAPIVAEMKKTHAIVVVTDDPAAAAREIPNHDHLLRGGDDKSDLAFMILCDRLVMGNSTFAWWAARLGDHAEVHVPDLWFPAIDARSCNDINMPGWITHPTGSARAPRNLGDLIAMIPPVDGVLHVGAHQGQEIPEYVAAGISRMAFVEPDPDNFKKLTDKAPAAAALFLTALGEAEGESVFHVASNAGQSSSILKPDAHLKEFPKVKFSKTHKVPVRRLDSLPLDFRLFELLVIDVQGAELAVLRGAGQALTHFSAIITEFHEEEFYENCALLAQIDLFLLPLGYKRMAEIRRGEKWGDALYLLHTDSEKSNH